MKCTILIIVSGVFVGGEGEGGRVFKTNIS